VRVSFVFRCCVIDIIILGLRALSREYDFILAHILVNYCINTYTLEWQVSMVQWGSTRKLGS